MFGIAKTMACREMDCTKAQFQWSIAFLEVGFYFGNMFDQKNGTKADRWFTLGFKGCPRVDLEQV